MTGLKIDGILLADGLSKEDQATLEALINVNATNRARNARLVSYYEGDIKPKDIGVHTIPDNVQVEEHCDWPRKAVTAVSERSRFSGFVFDEGTDGDSDGGLGSIVTNNSLIGAYNRHVHSELIHGCMFATVGRSSGGCQVRFHTAETSGALWDDTAGHIAAGFVIADQRLTEWSPTQAVPVQVNMHLPGRIVVLRRPTVSQWVAESLPIPIDRPAMEAFAYQPTGLKPFGRSRISKTVMSITDDVVRTLQNLAVSSAFYSSPQKALLGLSDEQFDTMAENKWLAYITNILMTTRDEDGNVPEFSQLTASSPEPYIAVLRTYATLFSGATGVPLNSLGIVQDNPSSAEAIEAAREDICICAESLNQSNGESLRNVALMAMAVENDSSIEELTDYQLSVMAKFLDPSKPSVVSQSDAASKISAAAPWFAQTDEFLRMVGFDEPTIRQLANARVLGSAQSLLAAFGSNRTQQTPAQVTGA